MREDDGEDVDIDVDDDDDDDVAEYDLHTKQKSLVGT